MIGGVAEEVVSGDQEDYLLQAILEVSMDANRSASIEVGENVLSRMGRITDLHKKRVEQAGFLVLNGASMPSVLVETAFISNRAEENFLRQNSFKNKVAEALHAAVISYRERVEVGR